MYLCSITYPKWLEFDSSIKFVKNDPTYADGHVHALVWCKVWQAIKGHFEAARDEYTHSLNFQQHHEDLHQHTQQTQGRRLVPSFL